jgi:hypothetical protein
MLGTPVRTHVRIMSRSEGYEAELVGVTISPEAAAWIKEEAEHHLNALLDNAGAAGPRWIGERVNESLNGPNDRRFHEVITELRNALRPFAPHEWFRRTDIDSSGQHILRRVRMYGVRYVVDLVQVPLSQEAMRYMSKLGREQLILIEKVSDWTVRFDLLAAILDQLLQAESRQQERVLAAEILSALQDTPHEQWLTSQPRERRDDYDD